MGKELDAKIKRFAKLSILEGQRKDEFLLGFAEAIENMNIGAAKKHRLYYLLFSNYVVKFRWKKDDTGKYGFSEKTVRFDDIDSQIFILFLVGRRYNFFIGHVAKDNENNVIAEFPSLFQYSLYQVFRGEKHYLEYMLLMMLAPEFNKALQIKDSKEEKNENDQIIEEIRSKIKDQGLILGLVAISSNKKYFDYAKNRIFPVRSMDFNDPNEKETDMNNMVYLFQLALSSGKRSFEYDCCLLILNVYYAFKISNIPVLLSIINKLYYEGYSQYDLIDITARLIIFNQSQESIESEIIKLLISVKLPLEPNVSVSSIFKINLAKALFDKNIEYFIKNYGIDTKSTEDFKFHNYLLCLFNKFKAEIEKDIGEEQIPDFRNTVDDMIDQLEKQPLNYNKESEDDIVKIGYLAGIYEKMYQDKVKSELPKPDLDPEKDLDYLKQQFQAIHDYLQKGVVPVVLLEQLNSYNTKVLNKAKDVKSVPEEFHYCRQYFAFHYLNLCNQLGMEMVVEDVVSLYRNYQFYSEIEESPQETDTLIDRIYAKYSEKTKSSLRRDENNNNLAALAI